MKKRIVAVSLALVLGLGPVSAYAGVGVIVDGQRLANAGQNVAIVDGRTFAPIVDIVQALGFAVDWDGSAAGPAVLRGFGMVVTLTVVRGELHADVNGSRVTIPSQMDGGMPMVPVRVVLESLGFGVDWDGATNSMIITTP